MPHIDRHRLAVRAATPRLIDGRGTLNADPGATRDGPSAPSDALEPRFRRPARAASAVGGGHARADNSVLAVMEAMAH